MHRRYIPMQTAIQPNHILHRRIIKFYRLFNLKRIELYISRLDKFLGLVVLQRNVFGDGLQL
jgi:hypothetical protein